MAAFDATTIKPIEIGGLSLDQIRKEAALAIPGDTAGPFVAHSLNLATAAAATEDVITAPGAGFSLFLVSIGIGPRTGSAANISMLPVFGVAAYSENSLPGINCGGAAQNHTAPPYELLVKLTANAKFGLTNLHATVAMLHRMLVRFCVVKA